jgi:hypothetical protein
MGEDSRAARALLAVAAALAALMLYQLARRIVFPWDYYMWSESPLLTDLLKLSNGQPLYNDPADVNAYDYTPGLEYLTYALLRPFSLQLDVRACRVVCVAAGFGAAYFASRASSRSKRYTCFAFLVFALILFQNFTFDVCHPDNLYAAHVGATFLLCVLATSRASYRLALAAVAISALGVFAKQTAALSCVGVIAMLLVRHGRAWGLEKSLALAATGAAFFTGALALLLRDAQARFYLFDLVNDRQLQLFRAKDVWHDVAYFPHRALLVVCAALALTRRDAPAERAAWLALGTATLPAFVSLLKANATWNNLGVVDYWLALLVVPATWRMLGARGGAVAAGALFLLLVFVAPTKEAPSPGLYAYGRTLDERLRADLAAGRRVLLPHGMMPLLRAGSREVPLDRAATSVEFALAGRSALAGTRARIEARYYDRIYCVVPAYPRDVLDAIEASYREVERLPGDETRRAGDEYTAGYQGFVHDPVRVMDRR